MAQSPVFPSSYSVKVSPWHFIPFKFVVLIQNCINFLKFFLFYAAFRDLTNICNTHRWGLLL